MKPSRLDELKANLAKHDSEGHLLWHGATDPRGFGRCYVPGFRSAQLVHRIAYQICFGEIPAGYDVDHLPSECDEVGCYNPCHLEAVPSHDRSRRVKSWVTHCPAGHDYGEPGNLKPRKDGRRDCKQCQRDRDAERNKP